MAHLCIRLLGPVQVTLDGQPVTHFETEKTRALLAYLAAEPGRLHRREVLAEMLWPGRQEGAARANLRHTLAGLRRAIGDHARPSGGDEPFLLPARHAIRFNDGGDAWVDVAAFEVLLSNQLSAAASVNRQAWQHLEDAVSLYRGPFLEDISLPDSAVFEEWLILRREHFRHQALDALYRLAECLERDGEYERALAHAWRRVELEPWDETAQQQVIRLLATTGRRAEALVQYEEFRRMLAEELGVEPTIDTTRLYARIQNDELELEAVVPAVAGKLEPAPRLPCFLVEESDAAEPPVFVARERELARLGTRLDKALAGQGQVVFVTGGPGRGKTALLAEFSRQAMEDHAELLVASGNCNAYSGTGDPYLPFRDIMAMLTGEVEARWLAGAVTTEHARRLWNMLPLAVQALQQHGPHVVPAIIDGHALLSRATCWSMEGTASDGAGPEPDDVPWLRQLAERVRQRSVVSEGVQQSGLFQQVTNVLCDLAKTHPLLLILDDLQWADTASAGLLFHLGRRLEGARILIAGVYRAEEVTLGRPSTVSGQMERHPLEKVLAEFKRAYGGAWLDLGEVEKSERRRFVDALLHVEPNRLGEDFRRALAKRTSGHPLFTLELLRAMQERGDLIQDGEGHWIEGPVIDWTALPARVEGVIEERVGRLDPELREILSVASVEGEDFTVQAVAQVQRVGERQILQALSQELGARHRLVREQGSLPVGQVRLARYRFAHALFQQYLYEQLGEGERTLLHGQVAAALERLYEGSTEAVAVQLAHHYARAGDRIRARKYYVLAGDVALASYANQEAEGHYRRGLTLAPGEPQRAHLLSGLGQALFRQSRFQEAIEIWREGIGLYQALADFDSVARLYDCSAVAARDAGDSPESVRLYEEGLITLSGAPESVGLAHLLCGAGERYVYSGMPEKGLPLAQRALQMAERLGAVDVQSKAMRLLGFSEKSLELLEKAVELAREAGLLELAWARQSLGVHKALVVADTRAARDITRQSAELFRQAGYTVDQVYALANVVLDSQWLGEFEEAEAELSRLRQLLSQLSEPGIAAYNTCLAESYQLGYRGEWSEATRLAHALLADTRERFPSYLGAAGSVLGWLALKSYDLGSGQVGGGWENVETALEEAVDIYGRLPFYAYDIEARAFLGAVRVYQGRLREGHRIFLEARGRSELHPTGWDEQSLLWLEARLARAEGRWSEAIAAFEALAGIYQRLGWRWWWARSLLARADVHLERGGPGDVKAAEALLRESRAMFQEMGIPRLAALATGRLQALGRGA